MIKLHYRIDILFNGVVKAYLVTMKRVGYWPLRKWIKVHEEQLYEGYSKTAADAAIQHRVGYERGAELKYSTYRNDRGEEEIITAIW